MRRLDLKLLAPIGLVCLALVGACLFAALYLSHLHVGVSENLTENVRSTQTAARLETTSKELMRLLRSPHADPDALAGQVREQNRAAEELLHEAQEQANLEHETILVGRIGEGLRNYLRGWEARAAVPPVERRAYDGRLAEQLDREVLTPCIELQRYNLNQIEASGKENSDVVSTLRWGMLAIGLGGSLCGLFLGYAVARRFRHSICQLSVRIRDAAGRLNRELGSVTLEEHGDLPDLDRRMQQVIEEIGRTVDQLQQREHEVLRAEQLAAVGQLAAGVAHELRNPLTSVKMLVQTGLEGDPPPGLPPDDLAVVEGEIRRMEEYLRAFLDFARPPRSERRRANLLEVVRRAATLVEGRARRQKADVILDLPDAPQVVEIDPEQVRQVLVNLLLNALDALPRGGWVRVGVAPGPAGVEVRVRDSGAGFPPEVLGRLFEPFVTGRENGVGLGLSICKRLVEAHGGTIRAANTPEGGAEVTLALPQESGGRGQESGGRGQGAGGLHADAAGRR
ncbi:MAG TPA: ATP-binding protein [Gemmataceae bacterium]|nr:ATP-binding protein [Gemmataceae bacterium]